MLASSSTAEVAERVGVQPGAVPGVEPVLDDVARLAGDRQRDDRGQRGLEGRAGGEHRSVGGLDALLDLAEAHPEQDAVVVRRVGAPGGRALAVELHPVPAAEHRAVDDVAGVEAGAQVRARAGTGQGGAVLAAPQHDLAAGDGAQQGAVARARRPRRPPRASRASGGGGRQPGRPRCGGPWPRARCRAGGRGPSGAGSAPARGGAPPHARTGRCAAGSRGNANPARRPGPDPSTTTTTTRRSGRHPASQARPVAGGQSSSSSGRGGDGVVDHVAVGGQDAQAERGAPGVVGGRHGGQPLAHRDAVAQPAVEGEQLGGGAVGGDRDERGVVAGRAGPAGRGGRWTGPRPGARGRSSRPRPAGPASRLVRTRPPSGVKVVTTVMRSGPAPVPTTSGSRVSGGTTASSTEVVSRRVGGVAGDAREQRALGVGQLDRGSARRAGGGRWAPRRRAVPSSPRRRSGG